MTDAAAIATEAPPPLPGSKSPLGDDVINAVAGAALRDVVAMRLAQIVEHGHTREADSDLPLDWLAREAQRRLVIAVDRIRGTCAPRDLPRARLAIVRAAALALAAIDRIDQCSSPSGMEPGAS